LAKTGAPWRDLPERFGPWRTAYHRFNRYRKDGTWGRVLEALTRAADLDHSQWNIDGTVIRAARSAAGAKKNPVPGEPEDHALGRSRGGWGTKLHLVCDAKGNPLGLLLTGGQRQEVTQSEALLASVPAGLGPPAALAGDKGYSASRVRAYLADGNVEDVVAHRKDDLARLPAPPAFDKGKYRRRNVIERLNGWLKERRRISTRYEKLAANFLAMVQLACILWYIKE
jgi:transposase